MKSLTWTAILAATAAFTSAALGSDWAQWRGPQGTGFAPDSNPPAVWSSEKNIRWKVELPGAGHSSPIILGDRIYVTSAVKTDKVAEPPSGESTGGAQASSQPPSREQGGRRGRRGGMRSRKPTNIHAFVVMALDRNSGSEIWRTTVREEVPHEGTHGTGSFASASPITDGEHVYAFFGSRGLFCLDMSGNVKWEKDLGDMRIRNSFGEGGSPALHGDTLVVPWDHEGDSFVAAFDRTTGAEKWRRSRNERTTWTTPVIVEVNGELQVIVAGTNASVAYDLATGNEIWRCSGLTNNVIPTPVIGHGMIYLTSGFRGAALQAVRLEAAKGDITNGEAIVWSHDRGTPYVPSPLLAGRNLYFLRNNTANVSCFDAVTGKEHFSGMRLENLGNVYSSPVGAGGRVYICDREGGVAVIEDGPEFKVIATNSIGEGIDATPAIVGDVIYLRGSRHLYCIGETKSE